MTMPRRLPRNVVVLGLVSFFTDVSSRMLYPVIPLFLTNTLGVVPALAGMVEGVAQAVASVMKGLSGRWSDRFNRRKPFIVAGYSLSAAAPRSVCIAAWTRWARSPGRCWVSFCWVG
jgi:MFS family permease